MLCVIRVEWLFMWLLLWLDGDLETSPCWVWESSAACVKDSFMVKHPHVPVMSFSPPIFGCARLYSHEHQACSRQTLTAQNIIETLSLYLTCTVIIQHIFWVISFVQTKEKLCLKDQSHISIWPQMADGKSFTYNKVVFFKELLCLQWVEIEQIEGKLSTSTKTCDNVLYRFVWLRDRIQSWRGTKAAVYLGQAEGNNCWPLDETTLNWHGKWVRELTLPEMWRLTSQRHQG